jgi:hypothetical protein
MRRSGGWPDRGSKLIAWVNYSGCVKGIGLGLWVSSNPGWITVWLIGRHLRSPSPTYPIRGASLLLAHLLLRLEGWA